MRVSRVRALSLAFVGALLVAVSGCSSPSCDLVVESTAETNGGKPFYAVVRAVEQATFVTDGYDSIAARVFANPPDPTVLSSDVIYPGIKAKLTFKKPDGGTVGVYFLFSQPSERWKISKVQPLPNTIDIGLDKNTIKEGS
jgi:hypothetical protein